MNAPRRVLAAVACVPVPLFGLAVALAAPGDRLVRYHGLQATVWTLLTLAALTLVGALGILLGDPARPVVDALGGVVLVAALGGLAWAAWGAAHGRYARLRPAWDLLAGQSSRR